MFQSIRFSRLKIICISSFASLAFLVQISATAQEKPPITDPGLIGFDRSHTLAGLVDPPPPKGQTPTPLGGAPPSSRAAASSRQPQQVPLGPDSYSLGAEYINFNSRGQSWHTFLLSFDNTADGWSASYGYLFGPSTGHALSFRREFAGRGVDFRQKLQTELNAYKPIDERQGMVPDRTWNEYRSTVISVNEAYLNYFRGTVLGWNASWVSLPGSVQEYSALLYRRSMLNSVGVASDAPGIIQTVAAGPVSRRQFGVGDHAGVRATYSLKWHDRTPKKGTLGSWRYRIGIMLIGESLQGDTAHGGAYLTADYKNSKSGLTIFGAIGVGLNQYQTAYFGVHLGPHSIRD